MKTFKEFINEEASINGVTLVTAKDSEIRKGESYVVYDKKTGKPVVSADGEKIAMRITRDSAKAIAATNPTKYAYASSGWYHDKIQPKK